MNGQKSNIPFRGSAAKSPMGWFTLFSLTLLALTAASCGNNAFQRGTNTSNQSAPGTFTIPAKVDILLVEDDTGSTAESYSQIAGQLPSFLDDLGQKGWDYRFATLPLTKSPARALNQIMASKYDGNWNNYGLWIAPYPGANPNSSALRVNSSYFRLPPSYGQAYNIYSHFLSTSDINYGANGKEPGFQRIDESLNQSLTKNYFLRNDALLVVFVISNGNDTSGVNFCTRSDGLVAPCDQVPPFNKECGTPGAYPSPYCSTSQQSFNQYLSKFAAVKSNIEQIRFYSAVSFVDSNNCLNGYSKAGTRYRDMATALGGASYDLCTQPISTALSAMSQHLQGQRLNMRTRYLVLESEPNVNTIQVTKHPGGSGSVTVPQSTTNGWEYVGYQSNQYLIDYPIPMNQASGWMIRLNGMSALTGADTADVAYELKTNNP